MHTGNVVSFYLNPIDSIRLESFSNESLASTRVCVCVFPLQPVLNINTDLRDIAMN